VTRICIGGKEALAVYIDHPPPRPDSCNRKSHHSLALSDGSYPAMAELGMFPIRCIVFDTFDLLDCPQPCISSGLSLFPIPLYIAITAGSSTFTFVFHRSTEEELRVIPLLSKSNHIFFLQHPLYHCDSFLLQLLANRVADFFGIRHQYTRSGNDAVKDQLCSNPTRYADCEGHRRVPAWCAIRLEC
jgi:hypothetical protein